MIDIEDLLQILDQARILHWQTDSYAEHKALGKFYDGLNVLVDTFVETAMGTMGRSRANGAFNISLRNYKDYDVSSYMTNVVNAFRKMKKDISDEYTDLQNILDEMLALANQTKYLLTLR